MSAVWNMIEPIMNVVDAHLVKGYRIRQEQARLVRESQYPPRKIDSFDAMPATHPDVVKVEVGLEFYVDLLKSDVHGILRSMDYSAERITLLLPSYGTLIVRTDELAPDDWQIVLSNETVIRKPENDSE